ncbi:hypothetical protein LTS12_006813 [Elasticomyces elasticus]|nr:hypothetical protein LTS12_006813 [Elasticomyces elasticus]
MFPQRGTDEDHSDTSSEGGGELADASSDGDDEIADASSDGGEETADASSDEREESADASSDGGEKTASSIPAPTLSSMDSELLHLLESNPCDHHSLQQLSASDDHGVQPLGTDEVRLIRVLPRTAGSSGLVRCETSVVSLSERPKYFALSYTWGSPPADHIIEINGREVLVRKNLWRFFNRSDSTGIDALCINQQSHSEVAQQISVMGRIYSQAVKVVVWLGPAHSDSDFAMQTLSENHARKKHGKLWNGPGGLAVARLCNRVYWTRLWVFQEIMLAKDVVLLCGDKSVSWEHFSNVMATSMSKAQLQRQQDRNMDYQSLVRSPAMAIAKQSVRAVDHRLWDLLMANKSLKCWEPRDKVYGLLGVARLEPGAEVRANYQIPVVRLANAVLKSHHMSEGTPLSTETVVAQCEQLTDAFGLLPGQLYALVREDGVDDLADVQRGGDCPLGNTAVRGVTLWWAVFYKHDAVERLLAANHADSLLISTWNWAIQEGEVSVVRTLLKLQRIHPHMRHSNKIKVKDGKFERRSSDSLAVACYYGHMEIAKVLMKHDLTLDYAADYDHDNLGTPLCAAVHNVALRAGDLQILRLLLEYGVDVNSNRCGGTALHLAASYGHEGAVSLLLQAGADINSNLDSRGTALQAAALKGYCGMVQLLLDGGADLKAPDKSDFTALQAASCNGHIEIVRLLLDKGADLHACDRFYGSALQAASCNGHVEVVQLLLTKGANANDKCGTHGHTLLCPAHKASSSRDFETVMRLLLQAGADPNERSDYCRDGTALVAACRGSTAGYIGSINILLEAGADMTAGGNGDESEGLEFDNALQAAAWYNSTAATKILLERGANVNAPGSDKFRACFAEHPHVEKRLGMLASTLKNGGKFGTALEDAAAFGHIDVVRLLLEAGAHYKYLGPSPIQVHQKEV